MVGINKPHIYYSSPDGGYVCYVNEKSPIHSEALGLGNTPIEAWLDWVDSTIAAGIIYLIEEQKHGILSR